MRDTEQEDSSQEERPSDDARQPVPQVREQLRRQEELTRALDEAEKRKIRARRRREESIWFGLGTFGLVGWSVAIPTLIGLALGLWLDAHYPQRFSWTLALLFAGIILGCVNAWYWVSRERAEIERDAENSHGD